MINKIEDVFNDAISMAKVVLKSSLCPDKLSNIKTDSDSILIMGNGPSLKEFLEKKSNFLEGKELLAVNYSVLSDYFEKLKPRYYVAIDPVVFCDETFCRRLFVPLAEKTTWHLDVFVPRNVRKKRLWREIINENKFIRIHYINTTPIKGEHIVTDFLFGRRLGMPSPRNVLVPSLMVSIWMGYKNIYTAGVEHSWHNQLWVNDDNQLMINDTHYYDNSSGGYSRHGNFTIDRLFGSLSLAFGSYHTINNFSQREGSSIYNVTEDSYIDAFKRLKP